MFESASFIDLNVKPAETVKPQRVAKPKPALAIDGVVNASQFNNDLAQAAVVAGNLAAMMRHYVWKGDFTRIADAWSEIEVAITLADDDDERDTLKKALASLRATLNTASKEVLVDVVSNEPAPVTVKDGEVVRAKTRNVATKQSDPLIEFVKSNAKLMTDAQKQSAIEAIKALMEV